MSGPSVKKPDTVYSILMPHEAVSMEPAAFDAFVNQYGVRLIHFRAIPCPVGLTSPTDIRRVHDDHSGCSNGFIYQAIGRVTCLFLSNQTQIRKLDAGFVDGSSVSVTFPRFYDNDPKRRVLVRAYDRFYLEEENIRVGGTNLMSRRHDGRSDRPSYPALAVHLLIDSDGVHYLQGQDFVLDRGDIVWQPGRGPAAGKVYSTWYEYQPYWYVDRLVHEIRVVPTRDFVNTHQIRSERLSFAAILNREYVHRDKRPDLLSPDIGGRQQQPPDLDLPAEPGVGPKFG
jgi:hypothetical protein